MLSDQEMKEHVKYERGCFFIFGYLFIIYAIIVYIGSLGISIYYISLLASNPAAIPDDFTKYIMAGIGISLLSCCIGLLIVLFGQSQDGVDVHVGPGRKYGRFITHHVEKTDKEIFYEKLLGIAFLFNILIIAIFVNFIRIKEEETTGEIAYISITRSDIFYHKEGCPSLGNEVQSYPLQTLKKQGYWACPNCFGSDD